MDYVKLRTRLDEVLAGKHDHRFEDLVTKIHCMSRPRVYAVINALVSCMDVGEIYVECGTYQGGSMIAALTGNEAQAVGVDNFAEFSATNSYERTQKNFDDFGIGGRVVLCNSGYKEFFAQARDDFKIAIYNYDGQHDYEGQLAGMEAGWKHLRPGSLIVVDDYSYREVLSAINQFVANHADHLKYLFVMSTFGPQEECHETYWNGIVVLQVV